jgi:hypothetical protein
MMKHGVRVAACRNPNIAQTLQESQETLLTMEPGPEPDKYGHTTLLQLLLLARGSGCTPLLINQLAEPEKHLGRQKRWNHFPLIDETQKNPLLFEFLGQGTL